jgi:hypothetical protein
MNKNLLENSTINMAYLEIAICSIVRNCGKKLEENILIVEKLRNRFKSSHVIIFENDSIDQTKIILKSWSEKYKNVIITCTDENDKTILDSDVGGYNKYFSKHRISKMANYRNNYLEKLEELNIDFDFVIVIDLDVSNIELEGIIHSFNLSRQWDVVTANGYSRSSSLKKRYHDTFALVEIGNENESQSETIIYKNQSKWAFLRKGMPLIPVYSAYGGLAIYKYELIKGLRYGVVLNNDSRVQVKCEHFFLHDSIKKKYNNARIFINPSMVILYQDITFELVKKVLIDNFTKMSKFIFTK